MTHNVRKRREKRRRSPVSFSIILLAAWCDQVALATASYPGAGSAFLELLDANQRRSSSYTLVSLNDSDVTDGASLASFSR